MFFNWYHKVILKYKYYRKSFSLEALKAAGSGSNLGFNYCHLEKPNRFFFPNPWETSIQLLLEAQQHKKYAQATPLDDGVSSLFSFESDKIFLACIFWNAFLLGFFLQSSYHFHTKLPDFKSLANGYRLNQFFNFFKILS
jgi:hypothetical protein